MEDLAQTAKALEILQANIASEDAAIRYLTDRGWKKAAGEYVMLKPTHGKTITDDEWFILQFLIDQYRFKGMRAQ